MLFTTHGPWAGDTAGTCMICQKGAAHRKITVSIIDREVVEQHIVGNGGTRTDDDVIPSDDGEDSKNEWEDVPEVESDEKQRPKTPLRFHQVNSTASRPNQKSAPTARIRQFEPTTCLRASPSNGLSMPGSPEHEKNATILLGIISSLFISGFSFYFPALFWFMLTKEGKWNDGWKNITLSVVNGVVFAMGIAILGCGKCASVQDITKEYSSGSVGTAFSCDSSNYT